MSSTRNEDMLINQNVNNIMSSLSHIHKYDTQFLTRFETPYSESSISNYIPKAELKCLRDPIDSRVTFVSKFKDVKM